MTRNRTRPVPLKALACFEAAGRHANFTHAARELGITQAAVSKQVKALESQVKARLFERGNRAVALTEAGRKLYEGVSAGMQTISETLEEISNSDHPAELAVTTTVAMASLWLMPRIASFRAEHPSISIRLIATDTLLDFAADRVDVAIRYGNGDWPHLNSSFLLGVRFFPVCSPDYLAKHPMKRAEDLLHVRLLNLEGPAARYSEWEWWFAANGVAVSKLDPELSFNNYPLLVQAATAGQGVLLAWGNVIDPLIEDGSLVRIIEGEIPANQSYYLVTNKRRAVREEARIFRDWFLANTRHLR